MSNFNFNKVILGGRLTSTPELKTTTNGLMVTTFSIAVGRKGTKGETDFVSCVAWRKTAELICNYFTKGSSICVTGAIQTRSWNDNNGNKRYATEVVVEEANFVDSKSDNGAVASDPKFGTTSVPEFETISADEGLPF